MRKSTVGSRTTTPLVPTVPATDAATRATASGTARYATRFVDALATDFFRGGADDLVVGSVGIGSYLGDCTDAEDDRYTAAMRHALGRGINVIDTAINYRCQRSERAIGRALREAIAGGEVERDEILVCTKGGYVPLDGAPPVKRSEYERYLQREFFEPGVMSPDEVAGGGHSLAPSFLRYTIERSRRNLDVRTIDLYYLHNPEQQLVSVSSATLRERLALAFAALEAAVERGDIGAYGCATWSGLRTPAGTKGHLSLVELLDVAEEVAGAAHHFRAVQLPVNLAMPEAMRQPTQRLRDGRVLPALEAAAALGLMVTTSATLMQGQLTQGLPEAMHALFPQARTDAQRALALVRALPGVTTTLVGMRRVEHVDENLEVASA